MFCYHIYITIFTYKSRMPKIRLKPNSAEYADDTHNGYAQARCDMPGCIHEAQHKAPKHRALNEYYSFCFEHVQEYNRAWNFFSGMNDDEVQDHLLKEMYGHRPTWKYGVNGDPNDVLREKAYGFQHGDESQYRKQKQEQRSQSYSGLSSNSQEFKALALMGLEPPITLPEIKVRYKELAKKHHPDLNKGCLKSEELLKQINMAYTVLKLAYEQFEDLPEQ